MRVVTIGVVAIALAVAGCSTNGSDDPSSVDAAANPTDYFSALETWSTDLATTMETIDQADPDSDDPAQHAEYRRKRLEAEIRMQSILSEITPAPETADAHTGLINGMQDIIDVEERLIDALDGASSAYEVTDGPMSAEVEMAGGAMLTACGELLAIARDLGVRVDLFCGGTEDGG